MARNIRNDITKERGSQATTPPTPPVQAEEQKLEVPAPIISPEQKAQEQNRMKQETDAMTADKGAQQASLDYGQMAQILDDNVKESRDAMTEEKARKRKRLFNAIGDGLGALTNLYFTTQGAPSVEYDPRGSLTARQQERWDAIDANRNALAQQEYQRKQNELAMRLAEQRQLRQEAIAARQRAEDKQWRQSEADRQYKQHQESLANQRAIQEMLMQNRLDQEKIAQSGMNYRAGVKGGGSGSSKKGTPYDLGNGEIIELPVTTYNNAATASDIFSAFPDSIKEAAKAEFATPGTMPGEYKSMTANQMWAAIGKYIKHKDAEAARNQMRIKARQEPMEGSTPKTFEGFEPTKSNKVDY